MRMILIIGCLLVGRMASGQTLYPSNWWIGMKHSTIQLIVRGDGVGKATAVSVNYPGVTVTNWRKGANPHYLILHLKISPETKPGTVTIGLTGAGSVALPLKERRKGNGTTYAQ